MLVHLLSICLFLFLFLFDADASTTKDAPTDCATHGLGLGGRLAGSYSIPVTLE
jgi:hypothetical protein